MPTLILTPRFTDDAQLLWRAAGQLGWKVERLTTWRVPPELAGIEEPVLYLEGLFGPTLAEFFGLKLPEPPTDWLVNLPEEYRKRRIALSTLGAARLLNVPAFVKPPNDKSFPARVYRGSQLPTEYPDDLQVLISEIVTWEKEFRCFVLDRSLHAASIYLRNGELQKDNCFFASDDELAEATAFLDVILADDRVVLPRATVIDIGIISGRGWAVIEQNAAWGSGIYGCDPKQILEVLRFAGERLK